MRRWARRGWVVLAVVAIACAPPATRPADPQRLEAPDPPASTHPPSTTTTTPTATSRSGPPPSHSTLPSAGPIAVRLMADAARLRGPAVIAPFPSDPATARMWMLGVAERLVTERPVPLFPGDFPYPLIMVGEQVVFSDLDTAYLVDPDTATPPVALTSAAWLLLGVSEGEVWAVGEGNAWVQRVDVTTGQAGERFDTEGLVVAPFGAVADGLAVWPADEPRHGRLAFWTPGTEPVPIEMRDPQQSGWLAAGGDLVALVSPGSLIDIVDVRTGQPVSSFQVDLGEDLIVDGCFSPQAFLAVVGSSGRVVVHLVEDGSLMQDLQGAQEFHGIGWTSPDQLLVITDGPEGQRLEAVDVFTGRADVVAELSGPAPRWWLATAGSAC